MIKQENKYTNLSNVYPNAIMIDASGAGLTDGSEFAALPLNDGWEPFQQAIMDYASGNANSPTGSVGVPNGVAGGAGVSQELEALQKAHGIGPGNYVQWGKFLDPSVTGDRILLLSEQGVLIATYPELDAATYVGDGNNASVAAAGGRFYRSSDSGGTTPNIAGPYLQLPAANPTYTRFYSEALGHFTVTGTGWTTDTALITLFQTSNGFWVAAINISGSLSSLSRTTLLVTISGLTFAGTSGSDFASSGTKGTSTGSITTMKARNGTGNLQLEHTTATTTAYGYSTVQLLSTKPTWANDFEFKWGIRY